MVSFKTKKVNNEIKYMNRQINQENENISLTKSCNRDEYLCTRVNKLYG